MDKEEIKEAISYGDNFLFLDEIIKIEKNRITAVKEFTGEEFFFKSHFAGFPIMPGTLVVEGLGQAAAALIRNSIENHKDKDILLYSIKEFRFYNPLFPKNKIRYIVELKYIDEKYAIVDGKVFDEKEILIAEGMLILAIVDKKEFRKNFQRS